MNKIHIDEIPKENSICFYTRHTIFPSERTTLYTLARQRIIECASEGLTNIILSLGDEYQVIAGRAALELRQKYNLHIYIILPYFCGCFCGAMWDRRLIQDASEIMELADGVTWLVLKYDGFSLGKSKHRTLYDSHMDYIANYFPKASIIIFRRVTNRNTGVYSMNEFATKYNSRIKNLTNTAAFKRLYRIQFNRKEAITEIAPIDSSFIEELKRDNIAYIVYKPGNEEIGWDNLYQAAKEEALQIVPSLYYQNGIRNYLVSIDTPVQIAIAEAILDFKRDTSDIKLYCIMKEDNNTDLIEPIFGELLYEVIEWIVLFANRLASVPDKKWKTMIDDMCSDFVYLVSPDSRYTKSEGMHIEEYPHGVIHGLYSIQNALLELDKQTWIEELVRYARYAGASGDVIREFRDELSNRNVNNLFAILCVSFPIPQSITWGVNEKSIYLFPDSARVSYCMDEIYRSLAERPKLRTGLRLVTGLDLEYQALPKLQPRPEDVYQIRFIGCGEITNHQAKRLLPLLSAIIALSCLTENKRVEFTSDLGLYNSSLWSAGCVQARAAYGLTKDYTYQYDCGNLTPYQVRLLYSMPTIDYSLASLKLSFLEYQRMLSENPMDLCIIIYNKRNLYQMKNQSEVLVMCKESNVKAIPLPVQLDIKADGMKILQKIYPSELLSKPEASEILNRLEVFKDN